MNIHLENHDREFYINQGRDYVLAAFHHNYIRRDSPASSFSGGAPKTAKQRLYPKMRRREGEITAEDIKRMHATETRSSGRSKPNLHINQEMHGFVHRCISELEGLEFIWVQFRYRGRGVARADYKNSFIRKYFEQYQKQCLVDCKAGTRHTVRTMISIAMIEKSSPSMVRASMPDIRDANWNQTYMPHWRRISADLAGIDSEALLKIGQKLN
jgi:hypothetical protein